MKLKDRVAVITGSGSGIGRAAAIEFAREGAKVVVADVNLAGARETVERIGQMGGESHAVETDVANPESVRNLVRETLRVFSRVNVLFNNAAVQVNKTVEDTTVEEWDREIAVNLGGVFLCSKFFMPHLRATKGAIAQLTVTGEQDKSIYSGKIRDEIYTPKGAQPVLAADSGAGGVLRQSAAWGDGAGDAAAREHGAAARAHPRASSGGAVLA